MGAVRTACRGAAWAVASAVLALPLTGPGGPLGHDLAVLGPQLEVSGDISGLVPGRPGVLRVTIHNPGDQVQLVHDLDVGVSGGGGACGPDDLAVSAWQGSLAVPAHASAVRDLAVQVAGGTACAGATWQLAYTAHD